MSCSVLGIQRTIGDSASVTRPGWSAFDQEIAVEMKVREFSRDVESRAQR